jgi:DNA polymerase I-like protein with 3'-5' exonuclease and polymerase domains
MSKIILITDQHPLDNASFCPFELGTIDECVEYISKQEVVGVDTETDGKDFTRKKIVMFQIGTADVQYVIDTRTVSIEPLRAYLEGSATKIFHNVKFDYKFIKSNYNIEVNNIYDTMLAECILHCGKDKWGYSLNSLTQRYLEISLNKEIRNKFIRLEGRPFTSEQICYGAQDVQFLLKIMDIQLKEIQKLDLYALLLLETKASLAFADIEYNGLCFDQESWLANADNNEGLVQELALKLDDEIIVNNMKDFINDYVQLNMFTPADELRKVSVKWSSPIQVKKVMNSYLNINLDKVNAFELYKYKDKPLVTKYLQYKEKQKISSTYGKSFLKYIMKDGKVRTSFWQVLNTGRVSSGSKEDRKPNMQNIPARNEFRNCFTAREGYSIVSVDYSGQELAIIAYGSQDPVWIKCRKNNEDLHSVCAELVFGDKWHTGDKKALRTMIKTINFGLAYGMSKFKLSDTLNISVDEADLLIKKYFSAFPNIKAFLNKLGQYGVDYGHIRTFKPFRRIRWFPGWYKGIAYAPQDFKTKGAIERASKNTPIQGTGADMIKQSMILIREHIKKFNLPCYIVTQVHDEIGVEVRDDFAEEWAKLQCKLMKEAGAMIIKGFDMTVDYTITKKWSK